MSISQSQAHDLNKKWRSNMKIRHFEIWQDSPLSGTRFLVKDADHKVTFYSVWAQNWVRVITVVQGKHAMNDMNKADAELYYTNLLNNDYTLVEK